MSSPLEVLLMDGDFLSRLRERVQPGQAIALGAVPYLADQRVLLDLEYGLVADETGSFSFYSATRFTGVRVGTMGTSRPFFPAAEFIAGLPQDEEVIEQARRSMSPEARDHYNPFCLDLQS